MGDKTRNTLCLTFMLFFFPNVKSFVDRVQVCAKGSNLGPLSISAIYCVLVINPNSVTSFANVIVSFDNQPISSSTPPPVANSTSAAAQPTTGAPTSESGTPTTTKASYTTVITVTDNGGMKVKWDFMSIFIFGLSSIIWYLGGLF